MDIGKKILNLRKEKHFSQEDLAEKINVTRQTISKWELGETSPDLKQASKIANIFNVTLDELIGNNTKDVLMRKVSNTERLTGIIIKILKWLGILIIIFIIVISSWFIYSYISEKNKPQYTDYYYTGRMNFYIKLDGINNYIFDIKEGDKVDIYVEIDDDGLIVGKYLENIEVAGITKKDEKMVGITIKSYEEENNDLVKISLIDNAKIIPVKNKETYNTKGKLVDKNTIQEYVDGRIKKVL